MSGRSANSAYSIAAATSSRSPTPPSNAPSLVPRTLLVPRVLNRSTANSASAGNRHAALRYTWLSIIPPCVGSGCRHTSVATGGPSSGNASSPTSVRPSAVCSSMSVHRAGRMELALIVCIGSTVSGRAAGALNVGVASVTCAPAAGVPVAPVTEVAPLVGRPGHDVRDPRPNLLVAAGAAVCLRCRARRDRAHLPVAVAPRLHGLDAAPH